MNTRFTEDKSPCSGLSFCMLVSSTVIEINILLIDQILDHFICQFVVSVLHSRKEKCSARS
jgi:hypothetical protein